jgi:hypothetical protein
LSGALAAESSCMSERITREQAKTRAIKFFITGCRPFAGTVETVLSGAVQTYLSIVASQPSLSLRSIKLHHF